MSKKDSNPNKGFIKELASRPQSKNEKTPFTYASPVTPESAQAVSMNTPRRLSEFKKVAAPKSQFTTETRTHINNRRGIK